MMFNYVWHILYVGLLLTNAVAILNEERFLAKIGWSTRNPPSANQGFGHAQNPNVYGGDAFGQAGTVGPDGLSIKAKLVNLISATRTVMRLPLIVVNVLVILYELALG